MAIASGFLWGSGMHVIRPDRPEHTQSHGVVSDSLFSYSGRDFTATAPAQKFRDWEIRDARLSAEIEAKNLLSASALPTYVVACSPSWLIGGSTLSSNFPF